MIQVRSLVRRNAAREPGVPRSPGTDVLGMGFVEILQQRDEGVLTGLHGGGPEPEGHLEHPVARHQIDFARDGDVPVLGAGIGLVQAPVGLQFLPSIGNPDEPHRSGEPRGR